MGINYDEKHGAKEIARILGNLDRTGQVITALAALIRGKATGHLAVTDGKGKLETLPLPGFESDGKSFSLRRRGQLEALRRGIRFDDDGVLWIELCPFSEIFVEHDPFNENPPWLEQAPFEEAFVERAFREAIPGGTLGGDAFIDLTPWNENPPFVDGPWNEEPPWVELERDHRGLTKSWRWKARSQEPLTPGDVDAARKLLAKSSIVETFERIKRDLDQP